MQVRPAHGTVALAKLQVHLGMRAAGHPPAQH
jgi:hypothetical protein